MLSVHSTTHIVHNKQEFYENYVLLFGADCVCVCGWQQMKALRSSSNIKQQTSSYRIYALYTSLYWRENKFTECIVHIYNYLHCFYIRCVFFIFRSFLLLFFLLLLFDEKHIGFGVDFKGVWIKNKAYRKQKSLMLLIWKA